MIGAVLLAAQVAPVPVAARNERVLWAWLPGAAMCDDRPVAATSLRRAHLAYAFASTDAPTGVTYRFRLDASGRPLSIAREGERYVPYGEDIGPALAASRFAPGPPRTGCTVSYTARRTVAAETPVADLISYTLNPAQGQLPRDAWAAIFPVAGNCNASPRPAPLVQAFPDFTKVRGTPGVRDWSMFAYDLDAKGAPQRISLLTGTGNVALDEAGRAALARSRYTNGPRTGCRYPFWRAAAVLPAPDAPDKAGLRPVAATCPDKLVWVTRPPLRYPETYRRRSIEGWALVGFDLAPWGATGSVRVLASEPSADFGEAAAQLIRGATVAASPAGATGCIERVRFVIERPGLTANTAATAPD